MKTTKSTALSSLLIVALAAAVSASSATHAKESPRESKNNQLACIDRISQNACPAGSYLDFEAARAGECSVAGEVKLLLSAGRVTAACLREDNCSYACKFPDSMCQPHGVSTITRETVTCNPPPGTAGPVEPPPPPPPAQYFINRYETGGNRQSRIESCAPGYTVIPQSASCFSTWPPHSGTPTGSYLGTAMFKCDWDKVSPGGVGLGITMGCQLTQ